MTETNEYRALVEKLAQITVEQDMPILEDTEIVYDLRISGMDLVDLLTWMSREYQVDLSQMNVAEYAPGEVEIVRPIVKLFGGRPYRSLRVRDLLNAILKKEWIARTG